MKLCTSIQLLISHYWKSVDTDLHSDLSTLLSREEMHWHWDQKAWIWANCIHMQKDECRQSPYIIPKN